MVAGKHYASHCNGSTHGANNNLGFGAHEIRSGMSVQDLKQLTAQRAQRQRLDYWNQAAARSSPRQTRASSHDWAMGSPITGSPQRHSFTSSPSMYPPYTSGSSSARRPRSASASPLGSERMFVTCGGQVVSFMEGVVNMPDVDALPESLSPL
ncbi:hypothetical protein PINS_up011615 [Pythium insidiosum]|nr:hypothetical protein PINS_up011615 [Pythium insidiosum]